MKKHLLTLVLTVIMVVGCTTSAFAAEFVGYINTQRVLHSHPDFQSVQQALHLEGQTQAAKLEKELKTKLENLDEKAKQELSQKYNQKFEQLMVEKQRTLMKPIQEKIMKAIATVAKANGITSVVEEGVMVYGGKDLNEAVIAIVAASK